MIYGPLCMSEIDLEDSGLILHSRVCDLAKSLEDEIFNMKVKI